MYVGTALAFVALNAGTALSPNFPALIVLRFLAGVAGSTGPTLGSGVIGDMFLPRFRGRAIAVYGLGPLLGPVVGNLISGYIVQASNSFRWLLWTLTIISGAIAVAIILFLHETFSPTLLERKQRRLAHVGAVSSRTRWVAETTVQVWAFVRPWTWHKSAAAQQKFRLAMTRPFRLLFGNPICAIFSLYQGFVYGVMFIFLTQHPLLFQRRDQLENSSNAVSSSPGSAAGNPATGHLAYFFQGQSSSAPSQPLIGLSGTTRMSSSREGYGNDTLAHVGPGAGAHHELGTPNVDPNLSRLHSYGWSIGNAGLSYLGLGIGFLVAMSVNAAVNDALYRRLVATRGRVTRHLLNPRVPCLQLAQDAEAHDIAHHAVVRSSADDTHMQLAAAHPAVHTPRRTLSQSTTTAATAAAPPPSSPIPPPPPPSLRPPPTRPHWGHSPAPEHDRDSSRGMSACWPTAAIQPSPPAYGTDEMTSAQADADANADADADRIRPIAPSPRMKSGQNAETNAADADAATDDHDDEPSSDEKGDGDGDVDGDGDGVDAEKAGATPRSEPASGTGAGTDEPAAVRQNSAGAAITGTQRTGQPEYRLPMCLMGMLVLPCGLLLFGWSASAQTHWSVPLLGSLVTGAGLILCFQTILMYLVDAFVPYSASATACSVLTRSVLAAIFPLFAEYLYAALGYGGGSSLLAGVALLGVPVPIFMFTHGQRLRARFAFHG